MKWILQRITLRKALEHAMARKIDEHLGTTPMEKALGAALVAKENLCPAEADALDWKTYNKQKLVISRSKDLQSYEKGNFVFRTCYNGSQVFATETKGSKTNRPLKSIMCWTWDRYFANLGQIGVKPMPGTVVGDGQGGARFPEVSFVPLALVNRPGLQGCNTRNEPWPSAVITIGVARTLPELLDDSRYYFTDPNSRVDFCLGIKLYCPTQQMVAFLRERRPDRDNGGTAATLTWALSFGMQPIGQSSIDVLATEGISQVLGLDASCTGPGIEAFKLLLKKERFFAPFEPNMAGELVQHMDKDVELDFYDVQQWCLGGLNDDRTLGPRPTREESARAFEGSKEMLQLAGHRTGLFEFFKGPDYKPPARAPEIEIEIPANLKPMKLPAWSGPVTEEEIERFTRINYVATMRDKARKEARARETGAGANTRSKRAKK